MPDNEIIHYADAYLAIIGTSVESRFIRAGDTAQCVPLTDTGMIIFIVEPSPAFGMDVLTLPGGLIDPNEAPEQAANRELQEEIGFYAEQLDYLGEMHPWPKYLQSRTYMYLARMLTPSQRPSDEHHEIRTELAPLDQFERLINAGRLYDASVIAALYRARALLNTDTRSRPRR
ncbi:MAG: NUDIX hydrolase [Chloroflexota bacterium]